MQTITDRTLITLRVIDKDGEKQVTETASPRREVSIDRDGYFKWAEKHLPQRVEERYTSNEFQVNRVTLLYTENFDGVMSLRHATISGPRYLASGRLSTKKDGDNTYNGNSTEMPSWLAHLVAAFDPTGTDHPYQA